MGEPRSACVRAKPVISVTTWCFDTLLCSPSTSDESGLRRRRAGPGHHLDPGLGGVSSSALEGGAWVPGTGRPASDFQAISTRNRHGVAALGEELGLSLTAAVRAPQAPLDEGLFGDFLRASVV